MTEYTIKPPPADAASAAESYTVGPPPQQEKTYYNEAGQPFTLSGRPPASPSQPPPAERLRESWSDEPGVYYGQTLPFGKREATGQIFLAYPEPIRSLVRGTADLLAGAGGELPYGQDISDEAKGALAAMEMSRGARGPSGPSGVLTWQRPPSDPKMSVGGVLAKPAQVALGWAFDIDRSKLAKSAELAEQGYHVAPSAYAPGAVRAQRWVDLSRILQQDPMRKGAERMAVTGMQGTFERSGMSPAAAVAERSRLASIESPDLESAGVAIKAEATREAGDKQAQLRLQIDNIQRGSEAQGARAVGERSKQLRDLVARAGAADTEVTGKLTDGWNAVQKIRDLADPRDLAPIMARKVQDLRDTVTQHAEARYAAADAAAGNATFDAKQLRPAARMFLEQLPDDLRRNMPGMVTAIGEFVKGKDTALTFGQARYLRSQLRDLGYLDNEKLSPSFRRGPYRYFAGQLNELIHSAETPALKEATGLLDSADAFYSKEMARFRDHAVQSLVDNMKAGLPPDPVAVSRQVIQAGDRNSLRLKEILNIAGPDASQQIRSADLDDILRMSKAPLSGEIDPGMLLHEVDHRDRNGTLALLWGPEAKEIVTLTQRLAARAGALPIDMLPHDDFRTFLQRANILSSEIDRLAKINPAKMMEAAVREGDRQVKELETGAAEAQKSDVLAGFANPQLMAARAAEELLSPNNLPRLREAVQRWGDNSEAVRRLRLVALEKVFAPLAKKDDPLKALEMLEGMPRAQQDILFPGGMGDDIKTLFSNLRLMYGRTVQAMPGFATGAILDKDLKGFLKRAIPIEIRAWVVSHPATVKTIAGLMNAGSRYQEQGREMLRDQLARWYLAGQLAEQGIEPGNEERQLRPPAAPPQNGTWRDRASAPARTGGWRLRQ